MALGFALAANVGRSWTNAKTLAEVQHADFLYLPMLFQDVFLEGGRLEDWSLTPSPYFFPDLLLYAPFRVLSANLDVATLGVMVLQPVLVGLLGWRLWRLAFDPAWAGAPVVSLAVALASASLVPGAFTPLLVVTCHGGQAVLGLLCLELAWHPSRRRTLAVALLAWAGTLSDPLFAFGFGVPMLFVIARRTPAWASAALKGGAVLAAVLLGVAARQVVPVPQASGLGTLTQMGEVVTRFARHASEPWSVLLLLGAALGALAVARAWPRAGPRTLAVALALVVLGTLAGLVGIGVDVDAADSRYLVSAWVALLLLVPAGLSSLPRVGAAARWLVVPALALAVGAFAWNAPGLARVGQVRPDAVACLDRLSLRHPVSRCVADYWVAKPLALQARAKVTVIQAFPNGQPRWWINTSRHVAEGVDVDCAVFPERLATVFVGLFGGPTDFEPCDGDVVLFYEGAKRGELNRLLQPMLHGDLVRR